MMSSNEQIQIPSVINPLLQDPYPNPTNPNPNFNSNPSKRKRNLPGTPDPDAEVIGLSPKSLMATNRFVCEICNKGFQRDQNLQLHKRGHNLPWKLKQRNSNEVVRKKVYICPENTCVHHDPSRALGDLAGIKKHYYRKHGEKKWKCDKCSKKYAVKSDWKAHSKICGTREYKCDCGTLFSRKDSFTTHRAFCDALVEESARFSSTPLVPSRNLHQMMNTTAGGNSGFSQEIGGLIESAGIGNINDHHLNLDLQKSRFPMWLDLDHHQVLNSAGNGIGNYPSSSRADFMVSDELSEFAASQTTPTSTQWLSRGQEEESFVVKEEENKRRSLSESISSSSLYYNQTNSSPSAAAPMSATALLQKAAQIGSTRSAPGFGLMSPSSFSSSNSFKRSRISNELEEYQNSMNEGGDQNSSSLTRDFLGVGGKENRDHFFASMAMYRNKSS